MSLPVLGVCLTPAGPNQHYTDAVREELYAPLYQAPAGSQTLTPLRRARHVMGLTWIDVAEASGLVGHTIQERRIRSTTGASVVAVMRNGTTVLNPDATYRFAAGDVLGVLGHAEQRQALQRLAQHSLQPPAEGCRGPQVMDGSHRTPPQE